jgi:hypothetical protein
MEKVIGQSKTKEKNNMILPEIVTKDKRIKRVGFEDSPDKIGNNYSNYKNIAFNEDEE